MRVYGYKQGKIGEFEIENTLEGIQNFVGGYVEAINLGDGVLLLCDEEARFKDKEVTSIINYNGIPIEIRGNFFFCRKDGHEFTDITDRDIKKYKARNMENGRKS